MKRATHVEMRNNAAFDKLMTELLLEMVRNTTVTSRTKRCFGPKSEIDEL